MSSQAAGWYDDPEDPTQQRYWDGNAWTDQRRPQQGPPPFQGQFGQSKTQDLPKYGQTAEHGQVYGGGGPAQSPQFGQQPPQQGGYPAYPQSGQGFAYQGRNSGTTPDGQMLSGWWRRVFARIIDGIIAWFIALPLTGYFYLQSSRVMNSWIEDVMDAARAGSSTPVSVPPEVYKWAVPASLLGALVAFVYEYLFLVAKGRTPGKMATGIAVRLREVPGKPPRAAAAKRTGVVLALTLAGSVPVLGLFASLALLLNYLWPLWDDKKQALHDKVAATNVVRV
ncbi:RDD family protein [Kribbella sindirgiensis]|uniref:RDD family protein n=1 Tax=Kribbella sindirgiensis TaxID=1124744 RepID=UPI0013F41AC2|nr:RDD family protein [Kribbella sindirgiensis]